jgi:hypothetical protein
MRIARFFYSRTSQAKKAGFSHTNESKAIEEVSGILGQTGVSSPWWNCMQILLNCAASGDKSRVSLVEP